MPNCEKTLNRIATLIAAQPDLDRDRFARVLADTVAANPEASLSANLLAAARRFPRSVFEAIEQESPDDPDPAGLEAVASQIRSRPIAWPLLVRHTAILDPDEPELTPYYGFVDDLRELHPDGPVDGEVIDWLDPVRDGVTLVVSLFHNELERDAFAEGWYQAGARDLSNRVCARHDVASAETSDGYVALASKPDPRCLLVYRDKRVYGMGAEITIVTPRGEILSGSRIPEYMQAEFS